MAKQYDVIVIGGGPAGLTAAKTAGENGFKVALLERKTDITQIRRACCEGMLGMFMYTMGDYVFFRPHDKRIYFLQNGLSIKYEGPYSNIFGFTMYSINGEKVESKEFKPGKEKNDISLSTQMAIDKEYLLKGLLDEVKRLDVDIFTGVNVTTAKKLKVGVAITGNGEIFEGKMAIAADGALSRIAQQLGFNRERTFMVSILWIIYRGVKGLYLPDPTAHIHIERGLGKTLICLTPGAREDEYDLCFGCPLPCSDIEYEAEHVMRESRFSSWFKNARIDKKKATAAITNHYSPIFVPYRDNVLLVGDSIWSTPAIGIPCAMLSGFKAANAVTIGHLEGKLNEDGVRSYLDWWKQVCNENDWTLPFRKAFLFSIFSQKKN
jgi:flavin-dependent dehydrogenase